LWMSSGVVMYSQAGMRFLVSDTGVEWLRCATDPAETGVSAGERDRRPA